MACTGGRAPPGQNKQMPCAGCRWPAEARGSHAPAPSASLPHPPEYRACDHCRDQTSSPTHAASAPCSRSSPQSSLPPPSAKCARLRDPEPAAPHGRGPRERTCLSFCSSWLHLLKSWSLRSTRGGSQGLERLGWVENRNIRIERRYAKGT